MHLLRLASLVTLLAGTALANPAAAPAALANPETCCPCETGRDLDARLCAPACCFGGGDR